MKAYLEKILALVNIMRAKLADKIGRTLTSLVDCILISVGVVWFLWFGLSGVLQLFFVDEAPSVITAQKDDPQAKAEKVTVAIENVVAAKPVEKPVVKEEKPEEPAPPKPVEVKEEVAPPPQPRVEEIKTPDPKVVFDAPLWKPLESLNPVYERPAQKAQKPRVYVIISNVGLREDLWKQVVSDFSGKVATSFSPYSPKLATLIDEAKAAGFSTLVDLPLETQDYPVEDSGPLTLITGVPETDNLARYNDLMKVAHRVDGLMGDGGNRLLLSEPDLKPILNAIRSGRFYFVDPQSTLQSQAQSLCNKMQVPFHRVDITMDEVVDLDKIDQTFTAASTHARENGFAVVRIVATPITLTQLQRWIKLGEEQGLVFEPLPSKSLLEPEVKNDRSKK